jgi:hypothetical protein
MTAVERRLVILAVEASREEPGCQSRGGGRGRGMNLYCGFHRKEGVRQASRFRID